MLSDPQSVTYDGSAKSLPAVGVKPPQSKGLVQTRAYVSPDGEFSLFMRQFAMSDGTRKTECELSRNVARDINSDTKVDAFLRNGFGFTITTNPFRKDSQSEVVLLQTALTSWLTSPVLTRLIGGEI